MAVTLANNNNNKIDENSVNPTTFLLVLLMRKLLSHKAQSNLFNSSRQRHHDVISPHHDITTLHYSTTDVTAMNRQRRDVDDVIRPPSRDNPFEQTRLTWKILKTRDGVCLRINNNGVVDGTTDTSDLSAILEFVAADIGLVYIRGVASGLFLTMDSRGRLRGERLPNPNAIFHERIIEKKYSLYSAPRVNTFKENICFVTLHRNRSGCTLSINHKHAHFLPHYIPNFNFIQGDFE